MAIKTIKATIQMRRGAEQDFDPDQMTAGEWAVSTDSKKVWMCFRAGLVLRMATYEAFEQDMLEIQTILATCKDIQAAVERFKQLAEQHASQAETWSVTSKSWAVGGTGTREGEDTNNSRFWSQQSQNHSKMSKSWAIGEGGMRPDESVNNAKYFAEQAGKIVDAAGAGGLIPAGTVTFENLPTSGMKRGWMYNISNDFTSDSRFEDGAGIKYKAGSNVYYTAEGKWDVLTGSHVTGVKGSAETNYRSGDVNITKANVGLGNVPNVTTNNQVPTFSQASARANIVSGEKLSVMLGKIMKWYADLKTVAFTGKYSDLSGRPAIPSVTNNLAATASGTALDAVQGKALNDKINQTNSNLSELVGRFRYIPPFIAEKQTGIFDYIIGFGLMLFIPYTFSYNKAILSNLRMFDEANTWNNVSGSFHGSVAAGGILFAIPTSSVEGMQFINHYSYGGQFSISIT